MKVPFKLKAKLVNKRILMMIIDDAIEAENFCDPQRGNIPLIPEDVQELMQPIFDEVKKRGGPDYKVKIAWSHYMLPGSSHTNHVHEFDTGVYYLTIPKDSGNLVFDDTFEYVPEEDLFIIVPGGQVHSINVNRSEGMRIAMAMELHK